MRTIHTHLAIGESKVTLGQTLKASNANASVVLKHIAMIKKHCPCTSFHMFFLKSHLVVLHASEKNRILQLSTKPKWHCETYQMLMGTGDFNKAQNPSQTVEGNAISNTLRRLSKAPYRAIHNSKQTSKGVKSDSMQRKLSI